MRAANYRVFREQAFSLGADRASATSNIAFMSVAVVIGALLGTVTIHVGGIPLSLSTSVGTLLAGLVCGYLRSAYRTFGRMPEPLCGSSTRLASMALSPSWGCMRPQG